MNHLNLKPTFTVLLSLNTLIYHMLTSNYYQLKKALIKFYTLNLILTQGQNVNVIRAILEEY